MAHTVVKPEKIAATAAVLLEQSLVEAALFQREGIDQYKGADDDTINVVVPGVLPYRTYGWRNDRSTSITFDEYAERKIAVTFGGDIYSAVRLTDEQNDFDFRGWSKLAAKQTESIGRGLNVKASDYLIDAPYEVTLGVPVYALRWGMIQARAILNRMQVPEGRRLFVVGTDWEAALLSDESLNLASSVGESEAVSSLRMATIGKRYGFDVVVSQSIAPTDAYAMVESAFVFATGAPSVPQSVAFGATASHEGVALRWLRDYDTEKFQDRSVFNTYQGFRHVTDELVGVDASTRQAFVTEYEHFVRAIKLVLTESKEDAKSEMDVPKASGGTTDAAKKATEFAKVTGIVEPTVPDAPGPQVVVVQGGSEE